MKKIIEGVGVDPGLESIIAGAVESARGNLEDHGKLLPVAIVGNSKTKSLNMVGLAFSDQKEKEMNIFMLRKYIEDTGADCVVTILETYYLASTDADGYDGGPVGDHPKAKEGVFVALENKIGTWSGMAEIIIDQNGRKTFGEVVLRDGGTFSGLFANLIPGGKTLLN